MQSAPTDLSNIREATSDNTCTKFLVVRRTLHWVQFVRCRYEIAELSVKLQCFAYGSWIGFKEE
jgi:hypothetical protein